MVCLTGVAPSGPIPGTYTVAQADGTTITMEIGEGLTWTSTDAEGVATSGTYELVDDQTCFQAEGSEEEPVCVTGSAPDENGVVIVTNADGTTSTVTPVVEEAAPAAE